MPEITTGATGKAARRKARRFLMQGLYQMLLTGQSAAEIEKQFLANHDMKRVDVSFFREHLKAISAQRDELNAIIAPCSERTIAEMDPVELSVLWVGVYELQNRIEIPFKVVINEAVELAKKFGATDSYKYINSVLDVLAAELRAVEVQAQT